MRALGCVSPTCRPGSIAGQWPAARWHFPCTQVNQAHGAQPESQGLASQSCHLGMHRNGELTGNSVVLLLPLDETLRTQPAAWVVSGPQFLFLSHVFLCVCVCV